MHRLRKTIDPCPTCRLHKSRCLCNDLPRLDLRTRVSLVVHAKELKRTTNTGRLAIHALANSSMHVRGEGRDALDLSSMLEPGYEPLFLYPSDDSVALESIDFSSCTKPIQLIVPDGNWRQAGKVHLRHKELAHVRRVSLSRPVTSTKHLRAESSADGMATLQAIALALGAIEGTEARDRLLALYELKLTRTLEGRGVARDSAPQLF